MADFISGDDSLILAPGGSVPLGGNTFLTDEPNVEFDYTETLSLPASPAEEIDAAFKMPSMYELYPQIVRFLDQELVNRGEVPAFAWDSIPAWDESPFKWDQLIGPETILRATERVRQLEMETLCRNINQLFTFNDFSRAPRELLPAHASQLGTPLPAATSLQQRSFLRNLVDTYRNKGTPLSFSRLFEQIGFVLDLRETYQRKSDAAEVPGPQMEQKSSNFIKDEPLGTVTTGVSYSFQLLSSPIARGTIRVEVFDTSANTPRVITDNGEGGWSDGIVGTINYTSGNITFTLPSVPTLTGQPIQATYRQMLDPFPDPFKLRFTDRVRSSIAKFAITPKDPFVSLTLEVIDRINLYLDLLKPAHVIIESLDLRLIFSEDEGANLDDDLNPLTTLLHMESVFGQLYYGAGWAAQSNASINPDISIGGIHRLNSGGGAATGEYEFLPRPIPDDPTREPAEAPYVYPFKYDGTFAQPTDAGGAIPLSRRLELDSGLERFQATITNDLAPSTTQVSITKGAGTALGTGDHICFEDGPAGGQNSKLTSLIDQTTYFEINFSPAVSIAPEVGDAISLLDIDSVKMNTLIVGSSSLERQQDPLEMKFGQFLAPAPDGLFTGPFTDTITASHLPVAAGSTSILRFVIAGTTYEETATGTGAFTNVNGFLSASSIDYGTGAVSATFTIAPDAATQIIVLTNIASTVALGAF